MMKNLKVQHLSEVLIFSAASISHVWENQTILRSTWWGSTKLMVYFALDVRVKTSRNNMKKREQNLFALVKYFTRKIDSEICRL